jgi:hypothetical protein
MTEETKKERYFIEFECPHEASLLLAAINLAIGIQKKAGARVLISEFISAVDVIGKAHDGDFLFKLGDRLNETICEMNGIKMDVKAFDTKEELKAFLSKLLNIDPEEME